MPRRQRVRHRAAVAEADDADAAAALGAGLQEGRGGDEILPRLRLIELLEQLARLVLFAGIAAERCQRIGGERDELVERQPAGDVFDVRVQARGSRARRERPGSFSAARRRTREVAAHLPGALRRRRYSRYSAFSRVVVLRDLLRLGELRVQ